MEDKFHHILKQYWGHDTFRTMQLDTILSVWEGRDTLVLMPTGGGKSIIYQVPTLAREGVCIVVTPLIALMKDQVDRLKRKRILAEAIHSGISAKDADRILDNCVWGDTKFLYISPERINSEMFRMRFSKMNVSLIAVDEAHCISQWGHDFRPAYLNIARLRKLQPEVTVLALTASATPKVAEEITANLMFVKPNTMMTSFARSNLSYVVRFTENKNEQMLRIINNVGGQGIIYVRTREMCEKLALTLTNEGISAEFYHGGMGYMQRTVKQDAWMGGKVRVMVATNAFGMGIDKADVRFVIHYDPCSSLEEYYQEAGRAGRDLLPAYAVMLVSSTDKLSSQKRLNLEFPPIETIKAVYEKIFNHFQIAIGEGKESARSFNIHEFCSVNKLFAPTVVSSIKILQQNGYMTLTDETDNPPRIQFEVSRDQLYRIRVERRELDVILVTLLRRYSGLFSGFVPIDIQELAALSGYTEEHCKELIKTLWQLRVIKYIPSNRSPLLFFHEERLPTADVRISPESYKLRMDIAAERMESVFRYATSKSCRSETLQHYFGETDTKPCGKCDICRTNNQSDNTSTKEQIIASLRQEPKSIKTLVSSITADQGLIIKELTVLLENGDITETKDGKLLLIS